MLKGNVECVVGSKRLRSMYRNACSGLWETK